MCTYYILLLIYNQIYPLTADSVDACTMIVPIIDDHAINDHRR